MPAEKSTHEVAEKSAAESPPPRSEKKPSPTPPLGRHTAEEEGKPQQVKPDGR